MALETQTLVARLRDWHESHAALKQKDLAGALDLSPQQLAEIFARRNRPTGEQVLKIQEFLRTNNMKTDFLDPRATPRPTNSDGRPKTLGLALEKIDSLQIRIRQLEQAQPKAAVASPAKPAFTVPAPTAKPAIATPAITQAPAQIKTGNIVENRGAAEKAPVKKALPPEADTPVLIQKILDVTNLDDLLAMLSNNAHTALQQSLIYQEVKKRRNLAANRFQ